MNPIKLYLNALNSPKSRYIVLILTLVYLISPIDILPDFFFPFGAIDDSILLLLMIYGVGSSVIEQISNKGQLTKKSK